MVSTRLSSARDSLYFIVLRRIGQRLHASAGEWVVASGASHQGAVHAEVRILAVAAEYLISIPHFRIAEVEK